MNMEQYKQWRAAGGMADLFPDDMPASKRTAALRTIIDAYDEAAVRKGITAKPFSGRVHTAPMGTTAALGHRQTEFTKQLEVAVTRAFQAVGWACWDCGGGVSAADQHVVICSNCKE